MRRPTFDLDVLRTFVTGVELNSFAKAACKPSDNACRYSADFPRCSEIRENGIDNYS